MTLHATNDIHLPGPSLSHVTISMGVLLILILIFNGIVITGDMALESCR